MANTILKRRDGCFACPVRCKRVVEVDKDDIKVDPKFGGPEYETIGAMGSLCGIGNLEVIAKAHERCNDLGIDTISAGVTIAFAMECYENGILTKEDTDGEELNFGNEKALLKLIEDIAHKKGLGKLLSKGVKKASEEIGNGSEEYAMHVKGQEIPLHEPRGKIGVGLGYSVSPTGADHMQIIHDTGMASEGTVLEKAKEIGITEPVDPKGYGKEKAEYYAKAEKWYSFFNMAGMCDFIPEPEKSMPFDKLMELLNAATGWNSNIEECLEVGERGITLARLVNYELGIDESHEELPKRFYKAFKDGPLKGVSMDREKFLDMKQEYYKFMGWDEKGKPTKETIKKLNI